MKILAKLNSRSPCLRCSIIQESRVGRNNLKQGERHLKCDIAIGKTEIRRLVYFYNSLGTLLPEIADQIDSGLDDDRLQKIERMTYKCLSLLGKLKAWENEPICPLISHFPNGKDMYDVEPEKIRLFLALKMHTSDTDASQNCLKHWKTHVISKALNLLWYLNTRLLSRKKKVYDWMNITVEQLEPGLSSAPSINCFLAQSGARAKKLMLNILDYTLTGRELEYTPAISPDGFYRVNNHTPQQVFMYYNSKSLIARLTKMKHQLVFIIVPVIPTTCDITSSWMAEWKRENKVVLGKLINDRLRSLQHDCRIVFLFEEPQIMEMCEYMTRTLSKALHVSYLCLSRGNECILLNEMSNVAQEWEESSVFDVYDSWQGWEEEQQIACQNLKAAPKTLERLWHEVKPVPEEHENLWQGWASTILAIKKHGVRIGLKKGVYMMALQLLRPPVIPPPPPKGIAEPITVQIYQEEYRKTLESYFDIDNMFTQLAKIYKIMEIPYSLLETLQQSKYSFEPVRGDREHGFNFHQAHNTALFLNIVSLVVRCLRDGVEKLDLTQFRKDVRALTARLDFKAKDRINNKKAHPRGNYKKKKLEDVLKKAVGQVLSQRFNAKKP